MELTDEERGLIQRVLGTAQRKYDEKIANLGHILRASGDAGDALGNAVRWVYRHADDPALEAAGLKVIQRGEDLYSGFVVFQIDGGLRPSVRVEYRHELVTYAILPRWLEHPNTVTIAVDSCAWALKRLDELTAVAVRYAKVADAVRHRELENSCDRVAKARHQLELLEKL